ncbi:MAG: hypothetical protein AB8G96_17010 [Phycisphaerales bacterium]
MRLRTAFLWTLIVSLAQAALLGIVVVILPDFIRSDDEILVTALLLGLHSLPSLACSIVVSRHRIRWAMWIGIVCSPVAWALWLPLIWGNPGRWRGGFDWDEILLKTGFSLTFLSVWAAHLGMLSLLRLDRPWFRRARVATLGVAAVLLAISIPAIWWEFDDELLIRFVAVLGILGGCGTIVTPILALLDSFRRRTGRESIDRDLRVKLVCPRCGADDSLRVGASQCGTCGLRIEVNVEEPRCACGYLLFRLTGDRCPECGRRARCACGCLVDDPRGTCPKCGSVLPGDADSRPA